MKPPARWDTAGRADRPSRRTALKRGALAIGFALHAPIDAGAEGGQSTPGLRSTAGRTLDPKEVDSCLEIGADGAVTVYTSKVDVGTGMRAAMAQMVAEELGVGPGRVSVVDGDTGRCPNHGGTGGSTGLTRGGASVRQAAATARQALLALAAPRLKRQVPDLTIAAGEVRSAAGGGGVGVWWEGAGSPFPSIRRPRSRRPRATR